MLPPCVAPGNIGLNSAVDSSQWYIDTLGLPTIFFTHSAADLQWHELARLICPEDPESRSSQTKAVIENPAISDWFYY